MQHDRYSGEPLAVCDECEELFNWRSSNLSGLCPRCARRQRR